jgi:GNAT superfamily N-acetyltransferase
VTVLDAPRWLTGRARLEVVSTLLQRRRLEHPTAGNFEAADLQWWWRVPRPTDDQPQPCWFDADGPVAAVTATQWRQGLGLDVHALPSLSAEAVAQVWSAAFDLRAGEAQVFAWWPDDDPLGASLLADHGYVPDGEGDVSGWLAARDAPAVSPLADGYRLQSRTDAVQAMHPLVARNGPDVEGRLRQTSLYRPDLDLAIVTGSGECAGYAVFWYDPATRVGLVEPLRIEEDHQRRGLARHLLTEGLGRLRDLGTDRIRISWEHDNPAASALYLDVGFTPTQRMSTYKPQR